MYCLWASMAYGNVFGDHCRWETIYSKTYPFK